MKQKIRDVILLNFMVMIIAMCFVACKSESIQEENQPDNEQINISQEKAASSEENVPDINYLILVDGSHVLPDDWEEHLELEYSINAVGDEVRTEKTAYNAYLKLKRELEKENVYVDLDSAYRSVEEQQKLLMISRRSMVQSTPEPTPLFPDILNITQVSL